MFFRQPSHSKYSENLIEYEITELKNEDVLRVLAQSKYWKRLCTIEILDYAQKNISKRVHDIYVWQCEKWHAACLLRTPIQGTYIGRS